MLTKQEIITNLIKQQNYFESDKINNVTKAESVKLARAFIQTLPFANYPNCLTHNSTDNINNGAVMEYAILRGVFGLTKEDDDHEIKGLVCNPSNILYDKNRKVAYIVSFFKGYHGLYKVNANEIYGERLTSMKKVAKIAPSLEKIYNLKELSQVINDNLKPLFNYNNNTQFYNYNLF